MRASEELKAWLHDRDVGSQVKDPESLQPMLKRIRELEERAQWLDCLEWAGVDNWDGFSYAQELLNEELAKENHNV